MRLLLRSNALILFCCCAFIGQSSLASDPTLPQFVTQPVDKTVLIDGEANFTPLVSSSSPATYQWHHNGIQIENKTNVNLTISGCSRADSGWYVLHIANDTGQVASEPAFLTTRGEPAGSIQFRNTTSNRVIATSGGNAHGVSIKLFAGPTPDRVLWTGASAIVNSGLFVGGTIPVDFASPGQTVFIRAELSDGQLSNLIPVNAGNGFVGGLLDDLRFPTFNNWPSPVLVNQPQNHEIYRGDELELTVEFVDYSEVTVRWIKDGNPVPVFEELIRLSQFTTFEGASTFRIPSTRLSDAGNYKAILISAYGDTIDVSANANVSVVIPPEGHIDSIDVVGERLLIQASGRPNRIYTLEFRSPDSDWISLFPESSPTGLFTFPTLTLPNNHSWFRLRSSN